MKTSLRYFPLLALPLLAALSFPASAQSQVSRNVTLLAQVNTHSPEYASCWSYVHPQDGREYAVLLTVDGASILRLTDPAHPVEVGFIPCATGRPWAEAAQYRNWIYLANDIKDNGLTVVRMDDPDHPRKVATSQLNAHTLTVDEGRGLLYCSGPNFTCPASDPTCSPGMIICSLADPDHPAEIGRYTADYVHTIHLRGNLGYASLSSSGTFNSPGQIAVLDLTDPSHPTEITRITTPRTIQHSTWSTEDGHYLYAANEVGRNGLTAWDVSNLSNIRQVYTFDDLPAHVVHNPVVKGNTLYLAYYTAGARLMDLRNPAWPVEYAYYDTWPGVDGGQFGAWMTVPFFPSGIFVTSDTNGGLFVFRASPPNYGIVRGTVRDANTGATITGALVTVQPSGLTVHSGSDGRYAFAVPVTGSATVTGTLFPYVTTARTVGVALGSDQTVDLSMALPPGAIRGTVTAASGGQVLTDAEVDLLGTPLHVVCDASGVYTFPAVPAGTYPIRCVRPGFAPRSGSVTVAKGTTTFNFALGGLVSYDDVEADRGWSLATAGDDAQLGVWVRAVPIGTIRCDAGNQLQTDRDHTPGAGTQCFVTGNPSLPCGLFFFGGVVAGHTTLTSPVLHLAGVSDPRVGYWRWYIFNDSGGESHDPLVVQLSNDAGVTWVTIETSFDQAAAWRFAEIRVKDFFANPGDVKVRFIVTHTDANFQPVEAAIDDIIVYPGAGGGLPAPALAGTGPASGLFIGRPRPSPSTGRTEIALSLPRAQAVRSDVYGVTGRHVATVFDGVMGAGQGVLRWNGQVDGGGTAASGVYWIGIRTAGADRRFKVVLIR
jgi:choice-of-anchor B domain-containing protein